MAVKMIENSEQNPFAAMDIQKQQVEEKMVFIAGILRLW